MPFAFATTPLPRPAQLGACMVAVWMLGCADPPPAEAPSAQVDEPAVDVGSPEPPTPLVLPDPPSDPWAAEGLDALRNGADVGWPVESVHVTSVFGWRVDPVAGTGTRMHKGTDFRGEVGDLVLSIADGEVTFVGHEPLLGTMVVVDHGLGITSLYGHLSDVLVWPGADVQRGAALGLVGNTGRSAAPHLHLTVKIDGDAVDPMMLLGQPLHRATALRGRPPRTRAPRPIDPASGQPEAVAPPVLQP